MVTSFNNSTCSIRCALPFGANSPVLVNREKERVPPLHLRTWGCYRNLIGYTIRSRTSLHKIAITVSLRVDVGQLIHMVSKATVLRSKLRLLSINIPKRLNRSRLICRDTKEPIVIALEIKNTCHKSQQTGADQQPPVRSALSHNCSSIYSAPSIGLARYGAISRNPRLRYIATAVRITGSTVSNRSFV